MSAEASDEHLIVPASQKGLYLKDSLRLRLTSSKRARMMVIQCLMVVMQSGWQTARITSPIATAVFTSTRFSSTFFMNSYINMRQNQKLDKSTYQYHS